MASPLVAVTGASAGIGAATAKRFVKAGYRVALIARRKEKLEALCKELGEKNAAAFALDVTHQDEVAATFAKIEKEMGPVDVLVNNAGLALGGLDSAQAAKIEEWVETVEVNIHGLLYCTKALLPSMVKRNRGHIINLGSVAGSYPYPGGNVYCGSKAFVHQFSLCLRSDLLGTKLRVSCIEPGLVSGTEFSYVRFHGDAAKAKSIYENTISLQPEDIAEAIFYCAAAPAHVNINTIEIMPVTQAFSPLAKAQKY